MHWSLTEDWSNINKIAIYGFGRVAKANIALLLRDFEIVAIIDNNEQLNGTYYNGVPIKSWNLYQQGNNTDYKIIVAATGRALESIEGLLKQQGKVKGKDYTDIGVFLGEWYLRFQNKLTIGRVAHSITQKCTFRCKDCQLLMPYIENPAHDDIEMLKNDLDLLFRTADFVSDFDIMGGETFLYPLLLEYLTYVIKNYKAQIGSIQIVSNASVIPSDEILDFIYTNGIKIRISDYSNEIPYGGKMEEFVKKLEQKQISYDRFKEMQWTAFGYPYETEFVSADKEMLKQHMIKCNGGMSRSLHAGKLFYCNTAGGAYQNMNYGMEVCDYIDLTSIDSNSKDDKIKIWNYCMGNLEKGGMKICRFCRGYADKTIIPAGTQLER